MEIKELVVEALGAYDNGLAAEFSLKLYSHPTFKPEGRNPSGKKFTSFDEVQETKQRMLNFMKEVVKILTKDR